jgi:hypothetical protein
MAIPVVPFVLRTHLKETELPQPAMLYGFGMSPLVNAFRHY